MTAQEKEMKPYQQRVCDEKEELDEKIVKLKEFMNSDVYAELLAVEQGLLMVQLVAMDNYFNVLGRRIECFS